MTNARSDSGGTPADEHAALEHWSALYHRLRWDSPGGVDTCGCRYVRRDSQGNDFVKLDYGVTKLTSLLSNSISNEILYQYGHELDYEGQQPYTGYTKADIATGDGNIPGARSRV